MASGLQYLHSLKPAVIHADLKGANVLISPERRACLADFGLASTRDSVVIRASSTIKASGTLRWQGARFDLSQIHKF